MDTRGDDRQQSTRVAACSVKADMNVAGSTPAMTEPVSSPASMGLQH